MKIQESAFRRAHAVASPMNGGSWALLTVLIVLLGATLVIAGLGWERLSGVAMSVSDYVLMLVAVTLALGVGFGLMALLFYSSREGYDDAPKWDVSSADQREPGSQQPATPANAVQTR
ncbi:MAG: hypothetical protein K2P80_02155 [Beijerinckiaceae bacterium]|nr:hypothetical protein [Beijerinckiaceae bacterium]